MPQERLIRKYSNRRLYDTNGSRHVTLDDLRQLIVGGEKIKVIDDKSGEDLTRSVLLQIISEQEQFGSPVLGAELLEMIIRFYGGPMQALLSRYLEQAFITMLKQQEAMQMEMAKALQTPFAPLTDLARKNVEMWNQVQTATRDALMGRSAETSKSANRDDAKAGPSGDKGTEAKQTQAETPPRGAKAPGGKNSGATAQNSKGSRQKGK